MDGYTSNPSRKDKVIIHIYCIPRGSPAPSTQNYNFIYIHPHPMHVAASSTMTQRNGCKWDVSRKRGQYRKQIVPARISRKVQKQGKQDLYHNISDRETRSPKSNARETEGGDRVGISEVASTTFWFEGREMWFRCL